MNLFIVENKDQAEDIRRLDIKGECKWIALGPSAMYHLEKMGIPYEIPENYCNLYEIEEACVKKYERLKKICFKLDEIILNKNSFLKEWSIRPFLFHLWQLGMAVDVLESRLMFLKAILVEYRDAKVYTHLSPPQPWSVFGIGFEKTENLWGRLLTLPGWNNQIITIPDNSFCQQKEPELSFINKLRKNSRNYIKSKQFKLLNVILSCRYGIGKNITRTIFSPHKKTNISVLVMGYPHEKDILHALVESKARIYFVDYQDLHIDFSQENNYMWSRETEALCEDLLNSIKTDGIDYTPILKERIYWIIENSQQIAEDVIRNISKTFNKNNIIINLLMSWSIPDFKNYIIKQYFIKKGISVLGWQQYGAVWYDQRINQRIDLIDMLSTNVLLTYGNAVKKAFETSDLESFCKIEAVGSTIFDRINRGESMHMGSRILYVITNYYGNAWYCGFSPPFSDRLYFLDQSTIINRLKDLSNEMNNISFTVKLHPGADVLGEDPPWVVDLENISNISVKRSPDFLEMLNNHDVVLIDTPTTTLLEAIATKLPVFVLTSIISPPRLDLPSLQKRAVCSANADDLMNELEKYLKTRHYTADVNNRDYLKLYGTHLDDGQSEARAEYIVKNLLNNGEKYDKP